MNDEEFGSLNLLKLKYRRGDQVIETVYKIPSPHIFDPPFLIYVSFKSLRNILLSHAECIEI